MNPKEMAEQIVSDLKEYSACCFDDCQECSKMALKTVQLIINANPTSNPLNGPVTSTMDYWMDVKGEIEKM